MTSFPSIDDPKRANQEDLGWLFFAAFGVFAEKMVEKLIKLQIYKVLKINVMIIKGEKF